MGDKAKISELTAATSVAATDTVAGVVSTNSRSITLEQILMSKALSDTRWKVLFIAATEMAKQGTNDPHFVKMQDDGSGSTGVYTYGFDKASEEELFFVLNLPNEWKIGTDIKIKAVWMPVDTDTGTIQWGLEHSTAEAGDSFPTSTLSLSTATAAGGTAYEHTRLEIDEIDLSGVTTMGAKILCRIYRNVAVDTYDNDAALIGIEMHYESDALGADTETTK